MLKRWSLIFVVALSLTTSGCLSLLRTVPGAVEGVVVDYEEKPLAGARVSIAGKDDLATVTDGDGAFRFAGIPSGPVVLIVDHPSTARRRPPFSFPTAARCKRSFSPEPTSGRGSNTVWGRSSRKTAAGPS